MKKFMATILLVVATLVGIIKVAEQPKMIVDYGSFSVYDIDGETPTVWSCCKDYYGESIDIRTVLPYVKKANNLDDRYTVHHGQRILLPEYHWE